MSTPPGRLTRGTIIDHALSQLGNKKIKAEARVALNFILYDLHTLYEWPHLHVSATVTLNQAYFALPASPSPIFLKTINDSSLIITLDGTVAIKHVVQETDRQTFETAAYPSDASGMPLIWTVDRTSDRGQVWPVPLTSYSAILWYKCLPSDVDVTDVVAYDASIPSFPWSRHLIQEVFVWGLQYESDSRYAEEEVKRTHQLGVIREAAMPLHSQINQIPLDPMIFKTPFYGD